MLNTDYMLSKYQNINLSDLDLTTQEVYPNYNNFKKNIDNGDVIEAALTGGTSMFQVGKKLNYSPLAGSIGTNNVTRFPKLQSPYLVLSGQQNVDEMLARKQQQRSLQNKQSLDGSFRSTKNCYKKYFNEELNENEHRVWWSHEAQDMETLY